MVAVFPFRVEVERGRHLASRCLDELPVRFHSDGRPPQPETLGDFHRVLWLLVVIGLIIARYSPHLKTARWNPGVLQAVLRVGADSSGFNDCGFGDWFRRSWLPCFGRFDNLCQGVNQPLDFVVKAFVRNRVCLATPQGS